jgi:hypothetical protein
MPDPVDELYTLPLRDFIAARDRLASKLALGNQRERAREVKALRRPTVAAWVVNQLAHRNRGDLRRLIDAGEVLRQAHGRVLRRGSADDLRAAAKRRQEALRALRAVVGEILREAGSTAHLDDVLATLEAASVDPGAAKAVIAGRLSRELPRPAGFGEGGQLSLLPPPRQAKPTRPTREPKRSPKLEAARKRRHARQLAAEARRLERKAARGEALAARASRRTATLERQVKQVREQLQAAERRVRDVEARLERARREESRASGQAQELRRSAEAARAQAKAPDA